MTHDARNVQITPPSVRAAVSPEIKLNSNSIRLVTPKLENPIGRLIETKMYPLPVLTPSSPKFKLILFPKHNLKKPPLPSLKYNLKS